MGGGAKLERLQEEPEAGAGLLGGDAEQLEHFLLDRLLVNADRAACRLLAVDHEVVGLGAGAAGVGIKEW